MSNFNGFCKSNLFMAFFYKLGVLRAIDLLASAVVLCGIRSNFRFCTTLLTFQMPAPGAVMNQALLTEYANNLAESSLANWRKVLLLRVANTQNQAGGTWTDGCTYPLFN